MSAVYSACEVCGDESFDERLCSHCEAESFGGRLCDQCNRWTINSVICDDCFQFRYPELPPQPLPTMAMFSVLPEPRLLPVLPPPCRLLCECHPPPPPLEPEIVDLTNEPESPPPPPLEPEIIDLTKPYVEVVSPRLVRSLDLVSDTSVRFRYAH